MSPIITHRQMLANLIPILRGNRNIIEVFEEMAQQHGDFVHASIAPKINVHFLFRPSSIKHVLQDNHRNYRKASFYGLVKKEFGQGLLFSNGEFWLRQRRMLQPAFHPNQIRTYAPIVIEATSRLMVRWQQYVEQDQVLDVDIEMKRLARSIISQVILGTDVSDLIEQVMEPISNTRALILGHIPFSTQQKRILMVRNAFDQVFRRAVAQENVSQKENQSMLSICLQAQDKKSGDRMSMQQVYDEVITHIFAGFDTTSRCLTWTWYLLDQNPHVLQTLYDELDSVLGQSTPTYSDLPQLRYTKMIINESLRLLPPSWIIGRQAYHDDYIDGFHIPSGSFIVMSQYLTHRHHEFWESPTRFDPEHFAPDRIPSRHRFAFFPFSAGPRQCIGKVLAESEILLIVAMIAQVFRLHLVPNHPVELDSKLTLRPRYGLPMRVRYR